MREALPEGLLLKRGMTEGRNDDGFEFIHLDGFDQIIKRAKLPGVERDSFITKRRNDNDLRRIFHRLDFRKHFQSSPARHFDIEQDTTNRPILLENGQRVVTVFRRSYGVSSFHQPLRLQTSNIFIVVNDENSRRNRIHGGNFQIALDDALQHPQAHSTFNNGFHSDLIHGITDLWRTRERNDRIADRQTANVPDQIDTGPYFGIKKDEVGLMFLNQGNGLESGSRAKHTDVFTGKRVRQQLNEESFSIDNENRGF